MEDDTETPKIDADLEVTDAEIAKMNELYSMIVQVCLGYPISTVTLVVTNILADMTLAYSKGDPTLIQAFSLQFAQHIALCIAKKVIAKLDTPPGD